jgi:predicted tellurium resistance membrane protein TerC
VGTLIRIVFGFFLMWVGVVILALGHSGLPIGLLVVIGFAVIAWGFVMIWTSTTRRRRRA